jgi:hypothetical protein
MGKGPSDKSGIEEIHLDPGEFRLDSNIPSKRDLEEEEKCR